MLLVACLIDMEDMHMFIECTLKVTVRTEFEDNISDAETVRYQLEQDLEDLGYDVDVSVLGQRYDTVTV